MSKKPETLMRNDVVEILRRAGLDPCPVESSTGPGIPDINYVGGWIELKRLADYPLRAETPIRVPLFTKEQRAWLMRRAAAGGRTWVLIRIAKDWYLFDGAEAADVLGSLTKEQMARHCRKVWEGRPHNLADYLTGVAT